MSSVSHEEGPAPTPRDDAELVARCRADEPGAWSELVERYSRYVYAITAQGFRLRDADAEDVFQEVFSRVYTRLHTLRDAAAFRPWLGQLTRRLCLDRLAELAREEPVEDLPVARGGATIETIDEAFDVREAMLSLSDSCQEILDRFFARDESYRTIGSALEIPAGTIASRISRCLKRLREQVEGRERTP